MNYQEMLARIAANPGSSNDGRTYQESSGGAEGGGSYYSDTPFSHTGSYFDGEMAYTPQGDGTFLVYPKAENGHASRLNGQVAKVVDAQGKVLREQVMRGISDNSSTRNIVGMLSVALGGPLLGGALVGAAAGGYGAGVGLSAAGGTGGSAAAGGAGFLGDATAAGYAGLDAASTTTLGGGASGAWGGGGLAGATGAAGGAAGTLDLGGGITMSADGAISGATPFSTSTLSNAGILESVGAGSLNPSLISQLATKLGIPPGAAETVAKTLGSSGLTSLLGPAATAVGGLLGSQGQDQSASTSRQLPDYLQGPVANDLIPRTQGLLASQMPQAQQAGNQMLAQGTSMMNGPVAGNGFMSGAVKLNQPTTATNPYLSGALDDLGRRTQDTLGQSFNQIRGNSVASGGMGGSRQGVAEGIAMKGAADSLQGQGANMYLQAYNADQNRALQQYGQDQSFYGSQRGQDLSQVGIGSGLVTQGLQTPWQPLSNTAGVYSPFSGFGQTTQNGTSGGGAMGLLGGALGGAQLAKNFGWFGSNNGSASNSGGTAGFDWTGSGGQNIF